MLYTRKGDNGTTKLFNSKSGERISKSSCQTEALGSLDELNSFLGLVKAKSAEDTKSIGGATLSQIVLDIQECLFVIQAQLAGAAKEIDRRKIVDMEKLIDGIEGGLPPIKTFLIPGGTELSALFDVARTLARRAERRAVGHYEENRQDAPQATLAYLNRLSSLLYALARWSNNEAGIREPAPCYNDVNK